MVGMVEVVMMGWGRVWEYGGGRGVMWMGEEGGVLDAPDEGGGGGNETVVDVKGRGDDRDGGVVPFERMTRSDMDDMVTFMSSREAVTEVWKVSSAWRMVERSGVAVFAGGYSRARLRVMLSTESARMSNMLMEDAVVTGEKGVEDADGTDVEDAAAVVAAAAAAAAAAARWEFLVLRGGMWRFGGEGSF
ncbi:hypothetical protein CBR_g30428 [Chara braunii]|uniref:Uncharacterized protein n=1 Tax=Chara braunii TaxID=69332 RepID=A0A388LCZ8_CHABU|nr:hypothetical protein CBR_g30428 [Chara braunii]|eukprot:GBG80062.1 hypothetical protein CBR_g30428 [Chara braunii]